MEQINEPEEGWANSRAEGHVEWARPNGDREDVDHGHLSDA